MATTGDKECGDAGCLVEWSDQWLQYFFLHTAFLFFLLSDDEQ